MSFLEQMYSSNGDSQKYTKQIKFRWAAEKADEFLHKLNDDHSQYQLSLLGNEVVRDVNNAVAILVNMIHRAAESMAISTTFKRNTSHRLPRWWNENCSKQKVIKNKLLNGFRMTNTTSDLNNYLTAKKCFRNVCKEAQKTDQEYLTIQLCDSVNDTTCFWKHIKSMNSKGNVIDKSEITGSEWNNYFKELLNNDVNIDEDFKTMTDDFVRAKAKALHASLCERMTTFERNINAAVDFAADTATEAFAATGINKVEINKINERCEYLEEKLHRAEQYNKKLEQKVIDLESYSRRDNLLFYGLDEEKGENAHACENKIRKIISDLGIEDVGDMKLVCCHRKGLFLKNRTRPIIVKFHWAGDIKKIMQAKKSKLPRESKIFISEDWPAEVDDRRKY